MVIRDSGGTLFASLSEQGEKLFLPTPLPEFPLLLTKSAKLGIVLSPFVCSKMGCDESTPLKGDTSSKSTRHASHKQSGNGYCSLDRQQRRKPSIDTACDPTTPRRKRQLDSNRVVSPDDVGFFCTIHRDDEFDDDPCPDSARGKCRESTDVAMDVGASFESLDESTEERILMQRYHRIRQSLNDGQSHGRKVNTPRELSPSLGPSFFSN
jgi:hypothetical protein